MPNKNQETKLSAALLLYDKLIQTHSDIERKGVTLPYTSLNGHMFSYINSEGTLNLRLSDEDRDAFINKYKTKLSEAHGLVQKEYVAVPDNLLSKTKKLQPYFEKSIAYVNSLKPKPTASKKSTKK